VVSLFQVDEVPDEVYKSSSSALVNYREEECLVQETDQQYGEEQQCSDDVQGHSRHSRVSSRHRSRSGDRSHSSNRHSSSPHRHVLIVFLYKYYLFISVCFKEISSYSM